MQSRINVVKVFSVTKARDRDEVGARVTAWIEANPQLKIVETFIRQSSDHQFHCLSMVFLCAAA